MSIPIDGSANAWQLIRRGPFARLWWAGFFSSMGDWVAFFATLTLAARLGGDLAETAILVPLVGRILPSLLFGPLAGILADRQDRRKAMVIADLGRGLLVLSLAFVNDLISLFVVSFALELLTIMWQPAKEASVPNLVPRASLVTANSLSLGAGYGTFPIGAVIFTLLARVSLVTGDLGGLLRNPQEGMAFMIDSVTFFLSASLVAAIPIPAPKVDETRRAQRRFDLRAPLRDLRDGFRFVARKRTVRPVVFGIAAALIGGGVLVALGPTYAERILQGDASAFGLLLTMLGTGAALGMISLAFGSRWLVRKDVVFALSLVAIGVSIAGTGWVTTVEGALGWVFLVGLGTGSAYVTGFTHLHEVVADEFRGRTFAALFALARTGVLVSIGVAGVAARALNGVLPPPFSSGTRMVFYLGGAVVLFTGLVTVWSLRALLGRPKLTPEALRSVEDASAIFTSLSGRSRRVEKESRPKNRPDGSE